MEEQLELPFRVVYDTFYNVRLNLDLKSGKVEYLYATDDIEKLLPLRYYVGRFSDVVYIDLKSDIICYMNNMNHESIYNLIQTKEFVTKYKYWKTVFKDDSLLVDTRLSVILYNFVTKTVEEKLFKNSYNLALPLPDSKDEILVIGNNNMLYRMGNYNSLPILVWYKQNVKFIKCEGMKEDTVGKNVIIEYVKRTTENFNIYPHLQDTYRLIGTIEPYEVKTDNKLIAICDTLFNNYTAANKDKIKDQVVNIRDKVKLSKILVQSDELDKYRKESISVMDVEVDKTIVGLNYSKMLYYPNANYLIVYSDDNITLEDLRELLGWQLCGIARVSSDK